MAENSPEQARRYELAAAFLIAASLLASAAWLLAHTLLRNIGVTSAELNAMRAALAPGCRDFLAPEPLERSLFIFLALASPLAMFAGLRLARAFRECFTPLHAIKAPYWIPGFAALLTGGTSIYLLHGKSLFLFFVFPESPLFDQGILYAAGALLFLLAFYPTLAARFQFDFLKWNDAFRLVMVVLVSAVVVLLPRGLSIRSMLTPQEISPFAWEAHFQAVAYPISQLYAGKPLLALAPLYGCYAVFLLPVFKLIGLSVFKVCMVMSVLQVIALAAVLLVAVRHVRLLPVMLLCCAALIYFTGSTCMVGRRPFDPVFQYWPIRFLFPALSIPVYLWAVRRATLSGWLAAGIFAGLGLMWNLDSGIAGAAAIAFALGLETITNKTHFSPEWKYGRFLPLCIFMVTLAVTAGLFRLCLQIQVDWKPPLHETAEYQRLFYESGFEMQPMPLVAHPWWLVTAVYLLGLGFGIQAFCKGSHNTSTRLSILLSILGIGLFTYYQGRSVDFNLMNAGWPAFLLGALLTDRLLRAIRAQIFPRGMCWAALPGVYLGMMAVAMAPGAMARTWEFGTKQWRNTLAHEPADAMQQRVAFIREKTGTDTGCAILADYQAVYFVETGLRSALDAPGLSEIFFMQDLEQLRGELEHSPPRHLFTDLKTLEALQVAGVVQQTYRVVSMSPDGKLIYMEPRVPNAQ